MQSTFAFIGIPYDAAMVVSAAAGALAAGFSLFRLRSRMRGSRGMVRASWLFLSGLQAGVGIWATHFVLALSVTGLPDMAFDPFLALASLLLTTGVSTLALTLAWTGRDILRTVAGGLLLALAAAVNGFTCLASAHIQGQIDFDPLTAWGSVVFCTLFACVALGAARRGETFARQAMGGGLFAASVLVMSTVSISSVNLVVDHAAAPPVHLMSHGFLTLVVVMLTVMITFCGMGAAYIDDTGSASALRRTRRLADAAREGIVVVGEDGSILDCNAAFCDLVGEPLDAILRRPLLDTVLRLDDQRALLQDRRMTGSVISAAGTAIPVEAYARALTDDRGDGRPSTVVAVRDLRERHEAERRIRHLSDHDALTGLPNRDALLRNIGEGLKRVIETRETLVVMNVEVANHRQVTELYGMAAGDALLCKVAERLQRVAAKPAFAARQHGADFTIVAFGPEGGTGQGGLEFARWLGAKLRRPLDFGGQSIEPQVLFGMSANPHDASTVDDLLAHATVALEQARREGESNPDGCCLFRADLHDAMREQRALARELKHAIADGQLVVYYQPQARVESGELSGFEALVRWKHPTRGLLAPDTFIPVAEEAGLIGALGEWVLRRACADAATWPRNVKVAVNLSPLQVSQEDLPELVHSVLFESGLSAKRLELEITESALFQNYQRALDVLRRLKALGVRIAMDDFGTGFSSLSTLHSFPFDKIKIDKSFVEGIGKLERSTVIVRAVLGIGRGLDIPVVAEGVETIDQLDFLRTEACAEVQGYHIGRPGPAESYVTMMETGETAATLVRAAFTTKPSTIPTPASASRPSSPSRACPSPKPPTSWLTSPVPRPISRSASKPSSGSASPTTRKPSPISPASSLLPAIREPNPLRLRNAREPTVLPPQPLRPDANPSPCRRRNRAPHPARAHPGRLRPGRLQRQDPRRHRPRPHRRPHPRSLAHPRPRPRPHQRQRRPLPLPLRPRRPPPSHRRRPRLRPPRAQRSQQHRRPLPHPHP